MTRHSTSGRALAQDHDTSFPPFDLCRRAPLGPVTVLLALIALIGHPIGAQDWQDHSAIAKLFEDAGIEGTFVLYDVEGERLIGHDRQRAEQRMLPASTFKIANSLIGLSVGAVADVDDILPYGGKPQPFDSWERDMGLRDAIKISNVPVYQELARRIGLERMQESVRSLGYGNQDIGDTVDTFWLRGPLAINAIEQTAFLARLAKDQLPLPEAAQRATREILILEEGDGWTLHGKTGWAVRDEPQIGWWVGWVNKQGRIYAFAINIAIRSRDDLEHRVALGRASLEALGIL